MFYIVFILKVKQVICYLPHNYCYIYIYISSSSFVAFLNKFLQCKTSLTEPHNLQQLMTDDVYVFFGVYKLLSPDIAAEEHMFTYRST